VTDNSDTKPEKVSAQRRKMIDLITREARAQGVDPVLALAIAETESGFNPAAKGDARWSELDGGKRYREHVLDNPKFAANPARTSPKEWFSYGLFQLLAPYHVGPSEHPRVLWDPAINAARGVAVLKQLMRKHGGDVAQVRLAYAGALKLEPAAQELVLRRFATNYRNWEARRELLA
jgi:hypothetical protein